MIYWLEFEIFVEDPGGGGGVLPYMAIQGCAAG